MTTSIPPITYTTLEYDGFIDELEKKIREKLGDDADYLLEYPIVYLHVWQSIEDKQKNQYSIYIGEANDIIDRTKSHWGDAHLPKDKRKSGNWQYHMLEDLGEGNKPVVPTLYVFGHQYFNKSFTMDVENRLIDFCLAIPAAQSYNRRGNPQGQYYGEEHFDSVFGKIWRELKNSNPKIFWPEKDIKKSALYKISPNHKLTKDQLIAKQMIFDKVSDAILYQKSNQLIMVEGDAGTGKTVLTSSVFFEILDKKIFHETEISAVLLINHKAQEETYKLLAKRLGFSENTIQNPTSFINNHSAENTVDIAFIDEAHLLWTQKNRGYHNKGNKQLRDIMNCAKITVIMFDENQTIRKGQHIQKNEILQLREYAKSQNGYIALNYQLRMDCSPDTMIWIDAITKDLVIKHLNKDPSYDIKIFSSPEALQTAIIKKANDTKNNKNFESGLSRIIATYDWPYNDTKAPEYPDKYWEVKIGSWHLPWNYELDTELTPIQRKKNKNLSWAEQPQTINEVGSTFTIQGFDLSYAGVIIGPSVWFDKNSGKIRFDTTKKASDDMKGKRKMDDGTMEDISEILAQHELRVLLSRGTNGLYIYACDHALREALINATKEEQR